MFTTNEIEDGPLKFKDINVSEYFSIPIVKVFSIANSPNSENFIKLRHNKAKSLTDKRIAHFEDDHIVYPKI